MATISLPPIKQRIRLTRELTHNYTGGYGYFLGDSEKLLKEHGCLVERALILDPGTELRIEAFKSFASSADWPDVKVTVKPQGGKDVKLYIPLVAFDGVSWELIKEVPKDAPKIIRRITIEFDEYSWASSYGFKDNNVYHEAFGGKYYSGSADQIINPLVFSEEERNNAGFVVVKEFDLGSVNVKIGKESWNYKVKLKKVNYFKFKIGKGVTTASLDDTSYHVDILGGPGGTLSDTPSMKFVSVKEITKEVIKEFVNTTLKEKHNL